MQTNYTSNNSWAKEYLHSAQLVVSQHARRRVQIASLDLDRKYATDLIVIAQSIAFRVRRPEYADKYPRQFTIRHYNKGVKTELEKIMEGCGDEFLYAHASKIRRGCFASWYYIDLHAFRFHLSNASRIRTSEIENLDDTRGRSYWIDSFPSNPPILIAESHPRPKTLQPVDLFSLLG